MEKEYKKLLPVEICEGICEIRKGDGCYIVGRKHEWAKRKYKRYPLMSIDKIIDKECEYYDNCKYGW